MWYDARTSGIYSLFRLSRLHSMAHCTKPKTFCPSHSPIYSSYRTAFQNWLTCCPSSKSSCTTDSLKGRILHVILIVSPRSRHAMISLTIPIATAGANSVEGIGTMMMRGLDGIRAGNVATIPCGHFGFRIGLGLRECHDSCLVLSPVVFLQRPETLSRQRIIDQSAAQSRLGIICVRSFLRRHR